MRQKLIILKTLLWLDDVRNPFEDDWLPLWAPRKDYSEVVWVENFQEFTDWISENGLPYCICFDHDLADEHYTPAHLWEDYQASKQYQERQNYTEKTGYDCAKWLVDYCMDNEEPIPPYRVHSANPVGRDNIISYLENYKNNVDGKI